MKILLSLLAAAFIVFLVIDGCASNPQPHKGIVCGKEFTPEETYTTVETQMVGDQQVSQVVTHYDPPRYHIVLSSTEDAVQKIEVESGAFYRINIGATVHYNSYHGCFTGWRWYNGLQNVDW